MTRSETASDQSAQAYVHDARNADVLVYMNGAMVPRGEAMVSVFDSGFVLGDGVWEGLRVVDGKPLCLAKHMDRLFESASAICLDIGMTRSEVEGAIRMTLAANGMHDGVHIRLMVTRGRKRTPNQDPRFAIGVPTVAIVAEYKTPRPESKAAGMVLATSVIRSSPPDVFDLRLNSHSRLNFIQALLQAINLGADEALMLDPSGFVASCNSTNFFIVRKGQVWTSTGRFNFMGITRQNVIDFCREAGDVVHEKDFTLAETYTADEAFVTGTLGGVTPVVRIDGRPIGAGTMGPVTARIAALYAEKVVAL